jgi:3-oxoacyl-[acyl-carrier protein] reductase
MRYEELAGKLAVVTGASRGIGWHVAAALHEAHAQVAITGRRRETLEAAARSIGERCHPYVCDQRDAASVAALASSVQRELGALDLLVANAGLMRGAKIEEMPLELWNEVIETNLTGTFLTVKAFLPALLSRPRGDIFIISSMSGKKGDPGASAYAASKFGLQGFAQSLMYEVRKRDIRVTVLNPSAVDVGADDGPLHGSGLYLHAADLAATIVHLARLPGRTMVRDLDVFGTNPP